MAIKIFVTGGTGWAGSALCKQIIQTETLELVGILSRKNAGKNYSDVLGLQIDPIPIFGDMETAISAVDFDVLVEYTKPNIAKTNILAALKIGKSVVVGTSGLSDTDYAEIEQIASQNNASVLAVGNFSMTVVLLQKFSEMAAKYIPNFEIIDYAHERKIDAPSGTARELAYRLSKVQESTVYIDENNIVGHKEARGTRLNGVQVHSVRLPSYIIAVESIFGLPDERLSIRHDAGASAIPYVQGAILAIEKVQTFKGLKRGLDSVMEF